MIYQFENLIAKPILIRNLSYIYLLLTHQTLIITILIKIKRILIKQLEA